MGNLVAQQITATALDEDIADLIDWVYVEQFSDFRVIVENTGGGSADDITDVQIDESDDGGETSDDDQHAATPAVPIVAAASSHKAFTSTAKWLRVRALCAAGEDTTGKVWLLADTQTGLLCTLADVRARLGKADADTDDDAMLNSIIQGVSAAIDTFCNRTFVVNSTDATEYYDGGTCKLYLPRFPVVSITSVTESSGYDWDNDTALTANEGYRLNERGILYRVGTRWLSGNETTRVVYRGGYTAAGSTPGTGETAMPNGVQEAAIVQTVYMFNQRDNLGLSSVGAIGANFTKFTEDKLLPEVQGMLKAFRRKVF
jgi:hypothetical protein